MTTALLNLLQLSDPTLPIGGYAHSSGLETYVQQGIVRNKETARDLIVQMLQYNLFYTDGALLSLAYDAAEKDDIKTLLSLDEECTAVKLAKEIRLASQKLGMRLIKIFHPLCNNELTAVYKNAIDTKQIAGNYCIAFGIYAFALGITKEEALQGFFYNAAVGFVTNSVKLVPLGQQEGQEILFGLHDLLSSLAKRALSPNKEMIGYCCPAFDIRSMEHERLYSRLYMS